MKNFTKIIVPALALAIGFTSCDKVPTEPATKTPTTTTPTAPTPITPTPNGNYWGVMVALKMKFSYTMPQLPIPVSLDTDMGIATFYSAAGSSTLVDAGTVSINGYDLKKETNNSYNITATTGMTPSSLELGNNVQWNVSGAGPVSSFYFAHSGNFPNYSGTLPSEINKAKDLEISLGSNITGADSVYVVIITSSKQIIKSFAGNPAPAKATISASELGTLPAVSDGSAYIEVLPFKYSIQNIATKEYVFIKEQAVVGTVNIN
jgi:hypothetical protein